MVYRIKKHKAFERALRKVKAGHSLVEYQKETSEFALQCNIHKICRTIFAGFPVFYRALENSIPLGGDEAKRAQGKLTAKGCNVDDPDYLIMWLNADTELQAVFIEFKKVGKNPEKEQRERHENLFQTIWVKTEIVHTPEEFWAVLDKYKIPNRGRGLI